MESTMRPPLSEAELTVLRVLWDLGPATVRSVSETLALQGRRWAYTTVQTLLHRLKAKGYAANESGEGPAHTFRALADREELLRDRLQSLADEFCEGTPVPLVLTLVENHRFNADELARLRALLDREEPQTSPRGKSRRS